MIPEINSSGERIQVCLNDSIAQTTLKTASVGILEATVLESEDLSKHYRACLCLTSRDPKKNFQFFFGHEMHEIII